MRYTFKIWLTTFIVAPALLLIIEYFIENNLPLSYPGMYLCMVIFGAMLSLPATAIFYALHHFLKKNTGDNTRKIILSLYTFVGVYITFVLFEATSIVHYLLWFAMYSLTMTGALWFYKDKALSRY